MNSGPERPRDLALVLLARDPGPSRARARDQQADRAGETLKREVLDRIVASDPDPESLDVVLASIAEDLGEPSGPSRAVCSLIRLEWDHVRTTPGLWDWLVSEALACGRGERAGRGGRRKGGNGGASLALGPSEG